MYSDKALYLSALVALTSIALIEAGSIKGRPQQDFDSPSQFPGRFSAPVKSPSANRLPPVVAPSKANLQPISFPRQPIVLPQQQEQQDSETEPSGAAAQADMSSLAPARAGNEPEQPEPEPYSFNYSFESGDSATSGSSERQEQQDASGKVTGFYTLKGEDGRDRRVEYTADASGFRAVVVTNELGTAPKNTADVEWQAQAPSEAQLRAAESATEIARQRARVELSGTRGKATNVNNRQLIDQQRESFASSSKTSPQFAAQQPQQQQYQESFEQVRTNELNARTRKSRHAPNFSEYAFLY